LKISIGEADGDLLYAKDEEAAAEIEDRFALHISIIASHILKREVATVLVLPRPADPISPIRRGK
jgi:hypothetical protein